MAITSLLSSSLSSVTSINNGPAIHPSVSLGIDRTTGVAQLLFPPRPERRPRLVRRFWLHTSPEQPCFHRSETADR
jgi:hypothetical protein